jgi:hypothetical protein
MLSHSNDRTFTEPCAIPARLGSGGNTVVNRACQNHSSWALGRGEP